ncbi:MAG: PAS domain-containing protein [Acidobacteriia bacterium]|nr:PAS domain-containing protein [Terriglobia bacterium]
MAAATAYYTLQHQGAVTAIAIVQAGLLISMYGGLLESWRRMRALQQRMQRTQVVLKLREYAEDVLESMPSALVLLSPQRRVLFANSTFLTAFRLRRDEVVGRRLEEVNGAYELASALRQMLQGGALRDEVILETATNPAEENGGLRILLRELKSADESREARLLLIVEGVVKSEEASVPTLGPLRSLR